MHQGIVGVGEKRHTHWVEGFFEAVSRFDIIEVLPEPGILLVVLKLSPSGFTLTLFVNSNIILENNFGTSEERGDCSIRDTPVSNGVPLSREQPLDGFDGLENSLRVLTLGHCKTECACYLRGNSLNKEARLRP